MSQPDHPNLTPLCHSFYAVGQKIWEEAQVAGLTNTQISTICSNVKNDRTTNYTTNSTHTAIMSTLAGLQLADRLTMVLGLLEKEASPERVDAEALQLFIGITEHLTSDQVDLFEDVCRGLSYKSLSDLDSQMSALRKSYFGY